MYSETNGTEGNKMSTDSNYSDYGYEYVLSFDEDEVFVIIPEGVTAGVLDFTEQDLMDMLAVLRDKKEQSQ